MTVPLKSLKAEDVEEQVKRMMGKFSEVAAIPSANLLVLTDTVGSIKRVLQFLRPLRESDVNSVLATLVLREGEDPTRLDIDAKAMEPLKTPAFPTGPYNIVPVYGPGYQTQRSPFLNLLIGGDPASSYFLGVRPEQQRRTVERAYGTVLRAHQQHRARMFEQIKTLIRSQERLRGQTEQNRGEFDMIGGFGGAGGPEGPPMTLPPPPGSGRGQGGSPMLPFDSIGGYGGLRHVPGGFAGRSGWMRRQQANQDKVVFGADLRAARALFRDLVSFAPGMDTTLADVLAVLEAEANLPLRSRAGKVAAAARNLIDRACAGGWEAVAVPAVDGVEGFTILCDGQGRHRYERLLETALRERVVCDGKTLLHLYSELGLGARRNVSRFHRRDLSALVPWLLPPADDLARGADLELIDKQTVAVLPHAGTVCLHLLFATDGRLAEQRLLSRKSGRLLERHTYAADGTVRRFDAHGKRLSEERLARRAAKAPDLQPDLKQLVVLPLPWRKRNVTQSDKLATLASLFAEKDATLRTFVTEHFLDKGDRRVGFLTLLAVGRDPDKVLARRLDPKSKLGDYLLQFHGDGPKRREQDFRRKAPTDFLSRMKALYRFHNLSGAREILSRVGEERLLDYVRTCKSPRLLWSLVETWSVARMPANEGTGPAQLRPRILEAAAQGLRGVHGFAYPARYEHARCLLHGDKRRARKLFDERVRRDAGRRSPAADRRRLPPCSGRRRQGNGTVAGNDAPYRRALAEGERSSGGHRRRRSVLVAGRCGTWR